MNFPLSTESLLDLSGRKLLVTGASLGIGAAVARLCAARGAQVVLHYASRVDAGLGHADACETLRAALVGAGGVAHCVDADLSEPGTGVHAVVAAHKALDGLDGLVLCASIQAHQPLAEVAADALARQTRINLDAQIELLQAALPMLRASGRGRIVSIGSVNQVRPHVELPVYAALKAALHNLVLGIARQNAGQGLTANTVSPGLIATPRNAWRRVDAQAWASIQRNANPMQRAGTAEEVAQLVALLLADAGAFITGAEIPIDGGARL